jgi:hypothetical protein
MKWRSWCMSMGFVISRCRGWISQQTVISDGEAPKGRATACCMTFLTGEQRVTLKSEIFLCNMKKFVSYLIENTFISTTKRNQLILLGEIIAVYCENCTKHTNSLCLWNAELHNVKSGGTYSHHCALKGYDSFQWSYISNCTSYGCPRLSHEILAVGISSL